ncbi:MAG TPA: hypothetical protein DCZ95_19665 [Verrucomicrobia bacterium]|nr:MAG: hypothetical protein A2X46_10890 [Lentisphaerae bacterium GWF2_57_35]HBA86304.1 hypothetical protein [Verrucomicrobiota bacterium]
MFIIVLIAIVHSAAAADALRLAIVADPGLRSLQDLLTASCSTNPAVTLVERDAFSVVLDELQLRDRMGAQTTASSGYMGADAVLIVSSNAVGNAAWLRFRWIAVGTGVVIEDDLLPYPLPALERIADAQAHRLTALASKFRLSRSDAIRISLDGIHALIAGPKSHLIEDAFSFLLAQQLMHEPRVLVLERERMRSLGEEKLLPNLANDEFWTGSYTLEGSFQPDGTNVGRWVLTASLGSPGASSPRTWEEKADESRLAEAVARLVVNIMSGLGEGTAKGWSPSEEAQRYVELAAWQFQAGSFEGARRSADAAWALGAPSVSARGMRMRIYAACAYPSMSVNSWYDPTLVTPGRLSEILDGAVMAANLGVDEIRHGVGVLSPDLSFNILSTLAAGAKVLRFLDDSATVVGRPADVAELRDALREVSLGLQARGQLGSSRYILDDLNKNFGALWGKAPTASQPTTGQSAEPAAVVLRNESPKAGAYLAVTNLWKPQRVAALKDQEGGGLLTGIHWHEGRIWLVWEHGVVAGSEKTVFSIDPDTQQSTFWPVPARPHTSDESGSSAGRLGVLCVVGNHCYMVDDTLVLEGDQATGVWRYLPAPEIRYETLAVADGKVYAGFSGTYLIISGVPNAEMLRQSGIVEIDPRVGSWRLIASSRRSPPEGPLDGCTPYAVEALWPWPASGLGALVFRPPSVCDIRRFAGGAWGDAVLSKSSIDATPGANGAFVGFSEGQKKLWQWQPRDADPAAPLESVNRAGMADVRPVCLPDGVAFDGHDAIALENEPDEPASRRLRWWREGRDEPVVIPLSLEGLSIPPGSVYVDPKGIVLSASYGFWFISWQELERFVEGLPACERARP